MTELGSSGTPGDPEVLMKHLRRRDRRERRSTGYVRPSGPAVGSFLTRLHHPGTSPLMQEKPRVLFLDATNSDRSQIAEALLRLRAGEEFEVCSAGLMPQPILEDTRRVLREAGANPEGLRPKSVGEFLARVPVRYGITLGQRGEPHAPRIYPFAARTWHWECPVPRDPRGAAAQLAMLREIRDDLEERIRQWLDSMPAENAARGHRLARRIA